MIRSNVREQILDQLDHLPDDLQVRVLEFASGLAAIPRRGMPGRNLLAFAGVLSEREAEEMERAIEEGCERVDPRDW